MGEVITAKFGSDCNIKSRSTSVHILGTAAMASDYMASRDATYHTSNIVLQAHPDYVLGDLDTS
jgi:hypothetical protein